jgi:VanZ family protein
MPVAAAPVAVRAREPRARYALFAFAAAAVFVASVVDPPTGGAVTAVGSAPSPLGVPLDKWVHAATYAVLAGLLCYATRARTTRAVLLAAVAVAGYGFAIELVQATLPARTFEPADALANAAGAVLAALAWRAVAALDRF